MVAERLKRITDSVRGAGGLNATGIIPGKDRGATLVEYALVLALLVVGSMGVINLLQASAENEVNNQADCVSMRPPPPECGYSPIPAAISYADPGVTPPTMAPPEDDPPPVLLIDAGRKEYSGPNWTVILPVKLRTGVEQEPPTDEPPGIPGIQIVAKVELGDPYVPGAYLPDPWFADCVTLDEGKCDLTFMVPYTDVNRVRMTIDSVAVSPSATLPTVIHAEFNR